MGIGYKGPSPALRAATKLVTAKENWTSIDVWSFLVLRVAMTIQHLSNPYLVCSTYNQITHTYSEGFDPKKMMVYRLMQYRGNTPPKTK
jgi:hypothetical protein